MVIKTIYQFAEEISKYFVFKAGIVFHLLKNSGVDVGEGNDLLFILIHALKQISRPDDKKKKSPKFLKNSPKSCQVERKPKYLQQSLIWKPKTSTSNHF